MADEEKRDRALKLMKVDREIIKEHLNLLVLQGSIESGKKLTRSEALTFFMNQVFQQKPEILKKISKTEEMRVVRRK